MTKQTLGNWLKGGGRLAGLLQVDESIDPYEYEATAILEHLERREPAPPPVHFTNPRNLQGEKSELGIVFNAYGSLEAVASGLDLTAQSWPELLSQYQSKVADIHKPLLLSGGGISVQEEVRQGADVDLRILPWTRHVLMDGGPYFTPTVVARAPDSERYNLSWNRAMYLDRRHLALHISPRHLWSYHRAVEEQGRDLPVALILGHHPAFNLAAASLASIDDDEYDIAGALMGEPVRVAASVSYGQDLLVPADADAVIEGRMLHGTRAVEGPFGEFLRYVGPQKLSQVIEVDAVTWRRGGNVLEIFTSHADHFNAHIAIEASLFQRARVAVPQVTGVSWFRGGGPTTLVVSIRKSAEGQPMRAAFAAMSASNTIKQVIVVDDDVDIEDSHRVLWAVSTRVRAAEDINIVQAIQGHLLDPSQIGYGSTSGFVIDATKPLADPFPPEAVVPDWALAKYPLANYGLDRR